MRIRNVKPGFYRSDDIDALTWEQRFFFIAMFSYVDDNGVGRDREVDICADLFAGDFSVEPGETLGRVRQCLLALVKQGLLVRYEDGGKRYLFVTGWDDHQYVKNPNPTRYPRPDKALLQGSVTPGEKPDSNSVAVPPALPPVVGSGLLVVGRESGVARPSDVRAKARRAVDPDWRPSDEVAAGIKAEHPTLDIAAEHKVFIDYWRGTGKPMKDWEAVWRNWMRRAAKEHARNASNGHSRSQNQLAANMAGWDAWVADEEAREERKAIGQ